MAAEVIAANKDRGGQCLGANLFAVVALLSGLAIRRNSPGRQLRGRPWLARLMPGLALVLAPALAADWQPLEPRPLAPVDAELAYAEASAQRQSDDQRVTAHLALFHSRAFRLAVVDLEPSLNADGARMDKAFLAAGIPAGVNGGFFHPDWRPLGLVIADGQRIHRLERAKLLSGVLYSDPGGNYLVRYAAFRDHAGIDALLQTGPYLVEHGRAVRGLSTTPPARRTFAATDWRGHWALGATRNPISLADLADCLATTGCLTDWPVERAINLDGGSSTGFFFADGPEGEAVVMPPFKRVRNLLGIRPR